MASIHDFFDTLTNNHDTPIVSMPCLHLRSSEGNSDPVKYLQKARFPHFTIQMKWLTFAVDFDVQLHRLLRAILVFAESFTLPPAHLSQKLFADRVLYRSGTHELILKKPQAQLKACSTHIDKIARMKARRQPAPLIKAKIHSFSTNDFSISIIKHYF